MNKKRTYEQFKAQKPRKGKLRKNDEEAEIENGGSSQDKFESDFIDDDSEAEASDGEYMVEKKQKVKHSTEELEDDNEEEYMSSTGEEQEKSKPKKVFSKPSKIIQESEDSDDDIYNKLKIKAEGRAGLGIIFKFNPQDQRYYLPGGFSIPDSIFDNLFDHQKIGIQWMFNLYNEEKGGVLGDDMGLGKTVQVATYLKGMFDSELIKKVLIVVPATMKMYWEGELKKWCCDCTNIIQFDDKKKANRYDQMKMIRKKGGILVTSYSMVTTERMNLTDMRYDIIVVDEGHKAKNKNTQFRRDITSLRVRGHRIILTGTPLQNNLSELWSVFDFVQPKIFGSFDRF